MPTLFEHTRQSLADAIRFLVSFVFLFKTVAAQKGAMKRTNKTNNKKKKKKSAPRPFFPFPAFFFFLFFFFFFCPSISISESLSPAAHQCQTPLGIDHVLVHMPAQGEGC
jgi:Na+/H+ antiporter NhaD/arsenite permease-like protein